MAIDKSVIQREVVPGAIWAIAKPFLRFNRAKIGGRASIIKLANGDLFVISPTPLEEGTQQWVDSIGKVKYLLGPNLEHYLYLKQWKEAYPDAEVIAPQGIDDKFKDFKVDFTFTPENLDRTFGDNEIQAHYFPGFAARDIAILHVPSGTFLNADLAENLPAKEQYSQTSEDGASGFWTGVFIKLFSPNNWLHNFAIWNVFAKDKEAMKRDVKIVSGWEFDRLIPCHGDVMETGAKQYWNALYTRFLH